MKDTKGYAQSMSGFYGPNHAEEHEHDDGKGGGTDRGKASDIREE